MLFILLLFALIRTLRGVPITSAVEPSDDFSFLDLRETQRHLGQRGVNDIIISCFATIFACTWSAVHPNIPAPTECWWTAFRRQTTTMLYALLAPEAVSSWALKQRLSARDIMDEYNSTILQDNKTRTTIYSIVAFVRGLFKDSLELPRYEEGKGPAWTLTHGFFVEMGGFVLCDRGKPIQALTLSDRPSERNKTDIIWNIEHGIIDPPIITEDDIQDRSKGDAISKTLIVVQTTWFVSQCVARWSAHLPVTELEIVTLGFAILNAITYGLWWHKPQNVGRPFFLERKKTRPVSKGLHGSTSKATATKNGSDPTTVKASEVLLSVERSGLHLTGDSTGQDPESKSQINSSKSSLQTQVHDDVKKYSVWVLPFLIPLRLLEAILLPLVKMAADIKNKQVSSGDLRVAMFYSGRARDPKTFIITMGIGVLFGSVHLIPAWFLDFASRQERWLWRASSIVITIGPVFLGTWSYLQAINHKGLLFKIFGKICVIGLPFYIISRIALLTQSLISLRALPPAALQTIDWTTFFPHI